jgi:hypothetical protein
MEVHSVVWDTPLSVSLSWMATDYNFLNTRVQL